MKFREDDQVVFKITNKTGDETGKFFFWCPGCKCGHMFEVPRWTWNQDFKKPTVSPSILYTGEKQCHLFIENGHLRFLDDCFHELKGQLIKMNPRDI